MNGIVKLKPMEKAQSRIASKHTFFAALTLSTPFIEKKVRTACTDMVKVYFDPDFIARCDTEEAIFVCIHEIMHILLKHGLRRGDREPKLWNIACDHVINLKLAENHFKLIMRPEWKDFGPQGFRCFADQKFKGMSEEHVYDRLVEEREEERKQKPEGQGPGPKRPGKQKCEPDDEEGEGGGDPQDGDEEGDEGGSGQGPDSDGGQDAGEDGQTWEDILETPGDKTVSEIEAKIDQDVARAVTIAKARGELPKGFETLIDQFFEAQVPWETVLARWFSAFVRSGSSWSRRNRRFVSMYLPGKKSVKIEEVDIIADSSGSMFDEKIFSRVGSEINYQIKKLQPELVRVIWADDADCSNQEEFRKGDDVILHPKGGGGTDMRKPLMFIEQYNPKFVILITDGYTPWPAEPTPFPLIVCCTTDAAVPDWAMEVRIKID